VSALINRLKGRQSAPPDFGQELDAMRLHPALAEATGRHRQLRDRTSAIMDELKPLAAERATLVAAHGEKALAAELAGQPLTTADLEQHEAALAHLDKRISRLAGQMDAVTRALPELETAIAQERKAAKGPVRQRAIELARPLAAEAVALARGLEDLQGRMRALRDAAEAAGCHSVPHIIPNWLQPDPGALLSWERGLVADGLIDSVSREPAPAPQPRRPKEPKPKAAPRGKGETRREEFPRRQHFALLRGER
jgi:hypothetical protein